MESLTDEQKDRLDKALKDKPDNPETFLDFFLAEIPDFDGMVKQEIEKLRGQLAAISKA